MDRFRLLVRLHQDKTTRYIKGTDLIVDLDGTTHVPITLRCRCTERNMKCTDDAYTYKAGIRILTLQYSSGRISFSSVYKPVFVMYTARSMKCTDVTYTGYYATIYFW